MTGGKVKAIARTLLNISCGADGLLDAARVRTIIKMLPREHDTLEILREYYSAVERKIRGQRMEICSHAAVDAEDAEHLRQHFEAMFGRKFSAKCTVDESLIAGIRVRAGDHIFERSIASALELLGAKT